jgi:undecaprenyl-diphosphatase
MEANRREEAPLFQSKWTTMMSDVVKAVILGIIEGITEFLPVSSTGHMLLAQRFFGLGEGAFWQSFVVLIQLGAILAIVMLYFG